MPCNHPFFFISNKNFIKTQRRICTSPITPEKDKDQEILKKIKNPTIAFSSNTPHQAMKDTFPNHIVCLHRPEQLCQHARANTISQTNGIFVIQSLGFPKSLRIRFPKF